MIFTVQPCSILHVALEAVLPTYSISYIIFAWSMKNSRRSLDSVGINLSNKTVEMHRKFTIMLITQVTLERECQQK